jgi:hypothetical protein
MHAADGTAQDAALERITLVQNHDQCVQASVVVEAIFENLDAKRVLFAGPLGFRVDGLGFRVWGFGFRFSKTSTPSVSSWLDSCLSPCVSVRECVFKCPAHCARVRALARVGASLGAHVETG